MIRNLLFLSCIFFSIETFAQPAATQASGKEPVDRLFLDAAITKLQHAKAYTLAVAESITVDTCLLK
jgi:hypothetical protein